MTNITNSKGTVIRTLTEEETAVYNAVEEVATRLNRWEYARQRAEAGKRLTSFKPDSTSLELLEVRRQMLKGVASPEDVKSALMKHSVRRKVKSCMKAGY